MTPSLDFDARDFTQSVAGPPVPIERLRALAMVRLILLAPLAVGPTAYFLWGLSADAWHPEAGRAAAITHSALLVLYVIGSLLLYVVAKRPRAAADRSVAALNGVGILCEVLAVSAFLWGTGSLASHSTAFFVVIIGAYRFTLGYSVGLWTLALVVVAFVAGALLELGGVLPVAPLLQAPLAHPAWTDPGYASNVVSGVLLPCVAMFACANYAHNQSARLHAYITDMVLRRYLPAALVDKAARGELQLDAPPERRVVTAMFTDLVGFTALSERLGPEAIGEAINGYLAAVADLAHIHGATVDKFIGDCVMVVFGTPEPLAEAEQARRAIALAQAIHEAVPRLSDDPPLQARTGINTGEAVAGNFGSQHRSDYTVLGPAVNLAARLESASKPGRILIGPATAALLQDDVKLEPTDPLHLKGVREAVTAYFVGDNA